ncbi:MAG: flagellin [Chloroflexi bacterium]|nr:flagellin [Chloroflexota bacterium]
MLNRYLNRMHTKQKGITGLETAIILIAFVVVAAVFAYTVLSAGLFSSQKSQEAVYSGMKEAQSTLQLVGSVIAFEGNTDKVSYVKLTLANALEGEPINFTTPTDTDWDGLADAAATNVIVVSYKDQYQRYDDISWTFTKLGNCDSDNLLETSERFEMVIPGTTAGAGNGDFEDLLATDLGINTDFTLEIKPPVGAVLPIERRTPAVIDPVMILD